MSKQLFLVKSPQQWNSWLWMVFMMLWGCGAPSTSSEDDTTQQTPINKSSTVKEASVTAKPQVKAVDKVNEKKQHILLIGDSMAGAAGLEYGFRKYATHNKHKLTVVSQASSNTAGWSKNKQLKAAIAIHKPTYVIISLGSNELFVQDLPQRKKYIKDIIAQAGDVPVVWAGPPNWRKDTGINETIGATVGKGRFFNSANVKIARQHDGIHPNLAGSIAWCNALSKWIMTESKYKIRLDNPMVASANTKH
jgi:lysophospholipase L1-like esterase